MRGSDARLTRGNDKDSGCGLHCGSGPGCGSGSLMSTCEVEIRETRALVYIFQLIGDLGVCRQNFDGIIIPASEPEPDLSDEPEPEPQRAPPPSSGMWDPTFAHPQGSLRNQLRVVDQAQDQNFDLGQVVFGDQVQTHLQLVCSKIKKNPQKRSSTQHQLDCPKIKKNPQKRSY